MGWQAHAEPLTDAARADYEALSASLSAPDCMLANGAVHLSRIRTGLQRLTGKSQYSTGLTPADVRSTVAALGSRHTSQAAAFLRIAATHGLAVRYLL